MAIQRHGWLYVEQRPTDDGPDEANANDRAPRARAADAPSTWYHDVFSCVSFMRSMGRTDGDGIRDKDTEGDEELVCRSEGATNLRRSCLGLIGRHCRRETADSETRN